MTRHIKKLLLTIFSVITWTLAIVWMIFWALLTFILLPVVPIKWSTYLWVVPSMPMAIRFTLTRLKVIYHPDFDPSRRSVFCQNHVSVLDGHLACAVIPTRFCGLLNASQFRIPGYGWILKLTKGIGVHSRSSGRTAELSAEVVNRVNEGISILAFPEGHRTMDGKVRKFRRGLFFIARDAGIPVVPIAVRGMHDVNHKPDSLITHPGNVITTFVGPQFETKGLSDAQVEQLAIDVRQLIVDWVSDAKLPDGVPNAPNPIPLWPFPSHYHKKQNVLEAAPQDIGSA